MSAHLRHTLIVMAMAFISTHAWAQQRFPISFSGEGAKSRWVQQHIIDVDDLAGHQAPATALPQKFALAH